MTNERAVEILKKLIPQPRRGDGKSTTHLMITEALDMAIKALGQTELDPSYNSVKTELRSSDDCISREKAVYVASGYCAPQNIADELRRLPSVTPTRPHGEWIHFTDDRKDYVACSCCGYGEEGEVLLEDKTPFCPVCGAKMEVEDEDSD